MEEISISCTERPEKHLTKEERRKHLTKEERPPKCYKDVEKIIRTVKSCQSNFKTVLANSRHRGAYFKKIYSMTLNVLKYYNYIQEIMNQIHLLEKEKFLHKEFATILIYEIIFGKGYIPGESKAVSVVRKYEKDIIKVHQMLESTNADKFAIKAINVPRYARVHTLVTTVAYVINDLKNFGFHEVSYDSELTEEGYLDLVKNLEHGCFLVDFHFKDMLVFNHSEKLVHLDIYVKGHIFLQDKASYIPVHTLNPEPGCAVLDACAAPGMKTVHMASKMKNKGILIACERDKIRFESLKEMIRHGSVKIAKIFCKDFKVLDPMDQAYSTVECILLDPSCSGSGMVSRLDEVTDTEDSKNKERLMKLSGFQIILLKHALKFPSVKRVVYSTCSVHEEENENVVHEVLQQFKDTFKLVSVMPEWSERGFDSFEFGHLCVRTVPEKHLTNGFFVAMFERIGNNKYEKGVRYSKYKKFQMNSDALLEDNIHSGLVKHEKDTSGTKETQSAENFEKLSILNSTIENDAYNGNLGTKTEKGEHDSNVNRKHKKKKQRVEESVNSFSHSKEELTNKLLINETSISATKDNSNENLKKITDYFDDSIMNKKHKKKKKSKKASGENNYPSEMTNEINISTTKDIFNENLRQEAVEKDINSKLNIKKKHKKERKEDNSYTTFSPTKGLINVLPFDENSILANKADFNVKSDREPTVSFDQETNVYKKQKKKKRKKNSNENLSIPIKELTNETNNEIWKEETKFSANSEKELPTENNHSDLNASKKHKKKKRRDDSFQILYTPIEELTNEIIGNEVLTVESISSVKLDNKTETEDFKCHLNINKKSKNKRKREHSTEFFCEPNKESTNVLIANESSILSVTNAEKEPTVGYSDINTEVNKKQKKKKKREDPLEIYQYSEQQTNKSLENEIWTMKEHNECISFKNNNGKDVSTQKLKKKKKKHSKYENDQEDQTTFKETQRTDGDAEICNQQHFKDNISLKEKMRKHSKHKT